MRVVKPLYLALVGGTLYAALETAWRGHTHWTMAAAGGLCFLLIGAAPPSVGLLLRALWGGLAVTAVEFAAGVVLNLWLGLGIWDYSSQPLNLLGQVCLPFSLAWGALSLPAAALSDFLKHRFFGAPMPRLAWSPTQNPPVSAPKHSKPGSSGPFS